MDNVEKGFVDRCRAHGANPGVMAKYASLQGLLEANPQLAGAAGGALMGAAGGALASKKHRLGGALAGGAIGGAAGYGGGAIMAFLRKMQAQRLIDSSLTDRAGHVPNRTLLDNDSSQNYVHPGLDRLMGRHAPPAQFPEGVVAHEYVSSRAGVPRPGRTPNMGAGSPDLTGLMPASPGSAENLLGIPLPGNGVVQEEYLRNLAQQISEQATAEALMDRKLNAGQ